MLGAVYRPLITVWLQLCESLVTEAKVLASKRVLNKTKNRCGHKMANHC
ncbi:hypothetical protein CRENPOLYSF2_3050007 [Crenothrix polyspora]|uniref:Uncharacterized protein n=1 Tax=Crenothrix polyspora TaxID=360316 RepID=A0A1R4H9V5_9GAMM|nr:hypothetical protein CRENPOLYSF2_3050007 [Crenothrix polyspora]